MMIKRDTFGPIFRELKRNLSYNKNVSANNVWIAFTTIARAKLEESISFCWGFDAASFLEIRRAVKLNARFIFVRGTAANARVNYTCNPCVLNDAERETRESPEV